MQEAEIASAIRLVHSPSTQDFSENEAPRRKLSRVLVSPGEYWKQFSVREKTVEILTFSKSIAFYGYHGSKSVWYYLGLHASNQNTTS